MGLGRVMVECVVDRLEEARVQGGVWPGTGPRGEGGAY